MHNFDEGAKVLFLKVSSDDGFLFDLNVLFIKKVYISLPRLVGIIYTLHFCLCLVFTCLFAVAFHAQHIRLVKIYSNQVRQKIEAIAEMQSLIQKITFILLAFTIAARATAVNLFTSNDDDDDGGNRYTATVSVNGYSEDVTISRGQVVVVFDSKKAGRKPINVDSAEAIDAPDGFACVFYSEGPSFVSQVVRQGRTFNPTFRDATRMYCYWLESREQVPILAEFVVTNDVFLDLVSVSRRQRLKSYDSNHQTVRRAAMLEVRAANVQCELWVSNQQVMLTVGEPLMDVTSNVQGVTCYYYREGIGG